MNESVEISPELRAEFQAAVQRALSGRRDPEALKAACEHMDRVRNDILRRQGIQDIGVELIREFRGELPER
jgi:hypothetical protein